MFTGEVSLFDNQIPEREARLMPGLNWCISQSSIPGGCKSVLLRQVGFAIPEKWQFLFLVEPQMLWSVLKRESVEYDM